MDFLTGYSSTGNQNVLAALEKNEFRWYLVAHDNLLFLVFEKQAMLLCSPPMWAWAWLTLSQTIAAHLRVLAIICCVISSNLHNGSLVEKSEFGLINAAF